MADVHGRRGSSGSPFNAYLMAGSMQLHDAASGRATPSTSLRGTLKGSIRLATDSLTGSTDSPKGSPRPGAPGPKLVQSDYTYHTARRNLTVTSRLLGADPLPAEALLRSMPAMRPASANSVNLAAWKAYGSPSARGMPRQPPPSSPAHMNPNPQLFGGYASKPTNRVHTVGGGFRIQRPQSAPQQGPPHGPGRPAMSYAHTHMGQPMAHGHRHEHPNGGPRKAFSGDGDSPASSPRSPSRRPAGSHRPPRPHAHHAGSDSGSNTPGRGQGGHAAGSGAAAVAAAAAAAVERVGELMSANQRAAQAEARMFEHTLPTDPYGKYLWEESARKARASIARHQANQSVAAAVGSDRGSRPSSARPGTGSKSPSSPTSSTAAVSGPYTSTPLGGGGTAVLMGGSGAAGGSRPRFSSTSIAELQRHGPEYKPPTVVGFAAPDMAEDHTLPGPGDPRWGYTRLGRTQIERLQGALKMGPDCSGGSGGASRPGSAAAGGGMAGMGHVSPSRARSPGRASPAFGGVGGGVLGGIEGHNHAHMHDHMVAAAPDAGALAAFRPGSAAAARPTSAAPRPPSGGARPPSAGMRPSLSGAGALPGEHAVPMPDGLRGESAGRTRDAPSHAKINLRDYIAEEHQDADAGADEHVDVDGTGEGEEGAVATHGSAGVSLPVHPDQLAARLTAVAERRAEEEEEEVQDQGPEAAVAEQEAYGAMGGLEEGAEAPRQGHGEEGAADEWVGRAEAEQGGGEAGDAAGSQGWRVQDHAMEQEAAGEAHTQQEWAGDDDVAGSHAYQEECAPYQAEHGESRQESEAVAEAGEGRYEEGRTDACAEEDGGYTPAEDATSLHHEQGAGGGAGAFSEQGAYGEEGEGLGIAEDAEEDAGGAEQQLDEHGWGGGAQLGSFGRTGSSLRPTSARPTSARPTSARPTSARPGSMGVGAPGRSSSGRMTALVEDAEHEEAVGEQGGMQAIVEQEEGGVEEEGEVVIEGDGEEGEVVMDGGGEEGGW